MNDVNNEDEYVENTVCCWSTGDERGTVFKGGEDLSDGASVNLIQEDAV